MLADPSTPAFMVGAMFDGDHLDRRPSSDALAVAAGVDGEDLGRGHDSRGDGFDGRDAGTVAEAAGDGLEHLGAGEGGVGDAEIVGEGVPDPFFGGDDSVVRVGRAVGVDRHFGEPPDLSIGGCPSGGGPNP